MTQVIFANDIVWNCCSPASNYKIAYDRHTTNKRCGALQARLFTVKQVENKSRHDPNG